MLAYIDSLTQKYSKVLSLDLPYFLRGGFWVTLSLVITITGGLFLSVLYARIWPSDVYGQYVFLLSAIGFLSLTTFPGLSQAVMQGVAEGKEGIFVKSLQLSFKWSFIGTILLVFGAFYFFLRDNPILAQATIICAVIFPLYSFTGLFASYLNGKGRFKISTLLTGSSQLSSIVVTSIILFIYPSIPLVMFGSLVTPTIINTLYTYKVYKSITNKIFDPRLLDLGKNLSLSQMLTMAADYSDKFLIPLYLGFSNNAIYAFATLIPLQAHNLLKMFTVVGIPKIAVATDEEIKNNLFKKALQLESVIFILVLLIVIFTPTIFENFYPSYQNSATFLSQLFSLSLLYYPTNILSLSLIRKRETRLINYINLIYLIFTFITLLVLLPIYGLLGAILSKILSRIVYSLSQIYFFKKAYY